MRGTCVVCGRPLPLGFLERITRADLPPVCRPPNNRPCRAEFRERFHQSGDTWPQAQDSNWRDPR